MVLNNIVENVTGKKPKQVLTLSDLTSKNTIKIKHIINASDLTKKIKGDY